MQGVLLRWVKRGHLTHAIVVNEDGNCQWIRVSGSAIDDGFGAYRLTPY